MAAWDVAVIGLGAMGSAAAAACASRGARVIGFDRFDPPHALGSSHGETRITREAYFEDPCYVPLVRRANVLWRELEREAGERLLVDTGGIVIGPPDGPLVRGSLASARTHDLPYERLSAAQIRHQFPALAPTDGLEGVWEPNAGVLFPERCVAAQLARARAYGAALHVNTPVAGWESEGAGFTVRAGGTTHHAAQLVLAANAWLPGLMGGAVLPLKVTRQPLFWFTPERDLADLAPGRLPVHIWQPDDGAAFYGFPAFGGTIKLAIHHGGVPSDPDHVDRNVTEAEVESIRQRVGPFLPAFAGTLARASVCLYANTPDEHFVVDRHPDHPGALVLSACSGHGFKFSIAIGEATADLVLDERPRPDLAPFRWRWSSANSSTEATPT